MLILHRFSLISTPSAIQAQAVWSENSDNWDILHSGVTCSDVWEMTTLGIKVVVLCASSTVLLHSLASYITHCKPRSIGAETNIEPALAMAAVVMHPRLEIELRQNRLLPALQKYAHLSPIAAGKNK